MTEKTTAPADDGTGVGETVTNGQPTAKTLERLSLLLPYLKPYKGEIWGAVISLLVAAGATLAIGPALRYLVDHGFDSQHSATIDQYFLGLFGVVCILGIATVLRSYLVSLLGERVVADLRADIFANLVRLTPEFYETNRASEIVSRLTADTSVIQSLVGSSMSVALRNVLLTAGGFIGLLLTSWKLSGLVLAIVPLIIFPIITLGRKVRRLSRLSQDRIADLGTHAGEALGAIQTVLAFTAENRETTAFRRAVAEAFSIARHRIWMRSLLTGVVIFFVFGGVDLVLWMGARDVVAGDMSSGALAQFIAFAVIAASSAGALSEVYGDLQRAGGATARLIELATTPPTVVDPETPIKLPPARGRVEFRHLRFNYPTRPKQAALNDFSLAIEPGERIALVGPSGAGKSTVFQLLLKFYMPQQGEIRLDGVNLADASSIDIRERMALVAQDPVIFAGSVADNIRYGRPDATDAEVKAAAEAAAAMEFISRLPKGLESVLGERGVLLSGGERQRLAIARAILRDPPVLLLDEATSALDAHNEQRVQGALDRLMAKRTSLIIAHRLSTILNADRIVVMDKGHIQAIGSHGELMAQGGLYAELASLQFDMDETLRRAAGS
jgi:ATP-binding cassette subfamily B protein